MSELTDLEVFEVSLVDKAANKRTFLILKNEGDLTMNELILNVDEAHGEILKAVAQALGTEGADAIFKAIVPMVDDAQAVTILKAVLAEDKNLLDAIVKAGVSTKAQAAVKAALQALKAVESEMPEDMMKMLAKAGGFPFPFAKPKPGEEDKTPAKKSYDIKKNADGTLDLSGVPEDVRPMVESLWKANEANEVRSINLEKTLKAERDERVRKEFVAKAAGFTKLSVDPNKFGLVLMKAADSMEEEDYAELERVLRGADAGLVDLFKQLGTDTDSVEDEEDPTIKLEKAAIAIAKRDGITPQQAFVKAMDENPTLAAQERAQRLSM